MTMTAPPHRLNVHPGTKLHNRIIIDSPFRNYGGTYLNLTAGAFSYIANDCFLYHIDIGRYSSIGDNTHILSQHPALLFIRLYLMCCILRHVISSGMKTEKLSGSQFKKVGVTILIATFVQKLINSRRFQPLGFHYESSANQSS